MLQICANGRMSQTQWRQIFRLIYKGAIDYEFADRIFLAIAGDRSQKLITFEDLIFCLYDLVKSFRDPDGSSENSKQNVPSTTNAQFTFTLMQPDSLVNLIIITFFDLSKLLPFETFSELSKNNILKFFFPLFFIF